MEKLKEILSKVSQCDIGRLVFLMNIFLEAILNILKIIVYQKT